jgi:hypothetical protein
MTTKEKAPQMGLLEVRLARLERMLSAWSTVLADAE